MKKLLVWLLVLCMPAFALAESLESLDVEITFEGETVSFDAYGFSLKIPDGWTSLDMMEAYDMRTVPFMEHDFDVLMYTMYMDETMEETVNVAVVPFEETEETAAMMETFAAYYGENGRWGIVNDTEMFAFFDEDADMCGCYVVGDGVLVALIGQPISNSDFLALFEQIVASFAFEA